MTPPSSTAALRGPRYGWALAYALGSPLLFRRRPLLALTVGCLSASLALVALQFAVYAGVLNQMSTYIDHVGADLWVMQEGSPDVFATSIVSHEVEHSLSLVDGIESATGIYSFYTSLVVRGRHVGAYVIGFNSKNGRGGPWTIVDRGRHFSGTGLRHDEIIVDEHMAHGAGIRVGDSVELLGREFTVAALSAQTSALGCPYLFLDRDALAALWPGAESVYTSILVFLKRGIDTSAGVEALQRVLPDYQVTSRHDLATRTRRFLGSFTLPVMGLITIVASVLALAICSFSMYNLTLSRREEIALLRAIGARPNWLAQLVVAQASIISVLGGAAGMLLTVLLIGLANWRVPGLNARLSGVAAALILASATGVSTLASILPILKLRHIDPGSMFRP